MADKVVYPESRGENTLPKELCDVLVAEPGVGFSLVDAQGVIRFLNARSAEIFLRAKPEDALGKSLNEVFGQKWADERLAVLREIERTGQAVIMRHIRHGQQVQSSIYRISEPEDSETLFLVITIEGEQDPEQPDDFKIIESSLTHLGPLESLTRREMEVLALIGHSMTTQQIADALHLSPRTVERHCDTLRLKLKSTNRVQLAEFARAAGLRLEDAERKRI